MLEVLVILFANNTMRKTSSSQNFHIHFNNFSGLENIIQNPILFQTFSSIVSLIFSHHTHSSGWIQPVLTVARVSKGPLPCLPRPSAHQGKQGLQGAQNVPFEEDSVHAPAQNRPLCLWLGEPTERPGLARTGDAWPMRRLSCVRS